MFGILIDVSILAIGLVFAMKPRLVARWMTTHIDLSDDGPGFEEVRNLARMLRNYDESNIDHSKMATMLLIIRLTGWLAAAIASVSLFANLSALRIG